MKIKTARKFLNRNVAKVLLDNASPSCKRRFMKCLSVVYKTNQKDTKYELYSRRGINLYALQSALPRMVS